MKVSYCSCYIEILILIKGLPKSDNPKTMISSEIKHRLDVDIKTEDIKYAIPIENTADHTTSYKINFYEQKIRDQVYSNRQNRSH